MFKNISFKKKLILFILPVVVLGLLGVSVIAYIENNIFIENELSNNMLKTTQEAANNIDTWIKGYLIECESIASTPDAKKVNLDFAATDVMNENQKHFQYLQGSVQKLHSTYHRLFKM